MAKPLIDAQHNSWASMDSEGKYGADGGPRPTFFAPITIAVTALAATLPVTFGSVA